MNQNIECYKIYLHFLPFETFIFGFCILSWYYYFRCVRICHSCQYFFGEVNMKDCNCDPTLRRFKSIILKSYRHENSIKIHMDRTTIFNLDSPAPVLYCYVCDDCPERKLEPLRHMAACPDEKHVSCIASLTTFGEHKSELNNVTRDVVFVMIWVKLLSAISRGCSRAPAVTSRGRAYNKYNGAVCSQHIVNIMRVCTFLKK